MAHLLINKNLEIHIDEPLENYNFSRFDWTGKIKNVKFQGIPLTTFESQECQDESILGQGFYNEFGIDSALGFEEAAIGEWFHKIGIGLLKKTNSIYSFSEKYEIRPAKFTVRTGSNKLIITCLSESFKGFAYILTKTIELKETGFSIQYQLVNNGERNIITDEYVHNFIGIGQSEIGVSYQLKLPFRLQIHRFRKTVNPEKKVVYLRKGFHFNNSINEQFFFSNLSGDESVSALWELRHIKHRIAIREHLNTPTDKINLWGWKHVISPELFHKINIPPGKSERWTRNFEIRKI